MYRRKTASCLLKTCRRRLNESASSPGKRLNIALLPGYLLSSYPLLINLAELLFFIFSVRFRRTDDIFATMFIETACLGKFEFKIQSILKWRSSEKFLVIIHMKYPLESISFQTVLFINYGTNLTQVALVLQCPNLTNPILVMT